MEKAVLYEKKGDDLVQCTACQRRCMIANGFSGKCGVRINHNGDLYLRVYGKAVSACVDPIEKKPFFHFLPGSRVFSIGTIGCNFQCIFCQNWDISQVSAIMREKHKSRDEAEVMIGEICEEGQSLSPREIVDYCLENKIEVIAYTYNEPTIFVEYAADVAALARKHGIRNVFVTNGYESEECLLFMQDWCDAMNIDIKSFSEEFYKEVCGGVRLKGVLDTVRRAFDLGIWVECTTLVVPDLNDGNEELRGIAEFIAGISVDIPWHVSAFHPDYKMGDHDSTPASTLERAVSVGQEAGLKYVYTGNIPGMADESTKCFSCKTVLVERVGMECLGNRVQGSKDGKTGECPKCGAKLKGIWK